MKKRKRKPRAKSFLQRIAEALERMSPTFAQPKRRLRVRSYLGGHRWARRR